MKPHELAWRQIKEFVLQLHFPEPAPEEIPSDPSEIPDEERVGFFVTDGVALPVTPNWLQRSGEEHPLVELPHPALQKALRTHLGHVIDAMTHAAMHPDHKIARLAATELYSLADRATRSLELVATERPGIVNGCAKGKASAPGRLRAGSKSLFDEVELAYKEAIGLSASSDVNLQRPDYANVETLYALWLILAMNHFHSTVQLPGEEPTLNLTFRQYADPPGPTDMCMPIPMPEDLTAKLVNGNATALNDWLCAREGLVQLIMMILSASASHAWQELGPLVSRRDEEDWDIRAPECNATVPLDLLAEVIALQKVSDEDLWAKVLLKLIRRLVPHHLKTGQIQKRGGPKTAGSDFGDRFSKAVKMLLPSNRF